MLEKDKSKRAFVIDLFPHFPSKVFKMDEIDVINFEAYGECKQAMERKRRIDGHRQHIAD